MLYLKEVFPEVSAQVPHAEFAEFVRNADRSGRSIGISSEAGQKRWAYLVMASNGIVLQNHEVRRFIQNGKAPPDIQVSVMIDMVAKSIRASGSKTSVSA